jgi:hypothetical protein
LGRSGAGPPTLSSSFRYPLAWPRRASAIFSSHAPHLVVGIQLRRLVTKAQPGVPHSPPGYARRRCMTRSSRNLEGAGGAACLPTLASTSTRSQTSSDSTGAVRGRGISAPSGCHRRAQRDPSPLALEARSFDSRRRCAGGATTSGASPSTPPTIDSSSSPWRGARVWLARIESTSPPSTGRPGQRGPTTWVGTFASTSAADLLRRPTRSASPSRAIWLPSWTAATGQRASAATSSSIAGA